MTNLTELLTQWIGEERLYIKDDTDGQEVILNMGEPSKAVYLIEVTDILKSKIPDFIEQIEKDRQKIYSDIDYIHYNLRNAIRSEREGTNIGRYKDEVDKWLGELKTLKSHVIM